MAMYNGTSDYRSVPLEMGSDGMTFIFVVVGTLGAIIWDLISNACSDYRLLRDFPVTVAVAVYFLSRITMLVAFIVITVANTRPFATDCPTLLSAMAWVLGASLSLTTLLFFCRVRAVYLDNKWVIRFFFLLWLGVVAGCITSCSRVAKDEPADGRPCCISDPTNSVSVVTSMSTIPMVNNVLGFFAVTWRILQNSLVETNFKNGFRVIIFGRYLPAFSKALLKDGQIYFLTTVSLAIVTTASFYSPGVSPLVSVAFAFPNVAMMNLMGGQIYRNTRLSSGQRADVSPHIPSYISHQLAFYTARPTTENSTVQSENSRTDHGNSGERIIEDTKSQRIDVEQG